MQEEIPVSPGAMFLNIVNADTNNTYSRLFEMTKAEFSRFLSGDWAVDDNLAKQLEQATGIGAGVWLGVEEKYRDALKEECL